MIPSVWLIDSFFSLIGTIILSILEVKIKKETGMSAHISLPDRIKERLEGKVL